LACGLATTVAAGTARADDPISRIPLGRAADVLIDPASGTVFVSGAANTFIDDGSSGGVVALHPDGTFAQKLTSDVDTSGMALGSDGRVYAAEDPASGDGSIVAIDPTGAVAPVQFPLAGVDCPRSLAAVGSTIWFSYGCAPATSALGHLEPDSGVVTKGLLSGARSAVSELAAIPGDPSDLLVTNANTGSTSASDLSLVSITGPEPMVTASVDTPVADLAVRPDGSGVVVATASSVIGYTLPSLTTGADQQFPTPNQHGGSAVAVSPDGHYVASATGTDVSWTDTLTTYGPDSTSAIRTYDTSTPGSANVGQSNNPVAGALAWSASHVLYAVYADYGNGYPTMHVLHSALQHVTSMTLTGPAKAARGGTVRLSGVLKSSGQVLPNTRLTVARSDLSGRHTLPTVTTGADGEYVIVDHPPVGTRNSYIVSYRGDASHTPVSRTHYVLVSRARTALSIALKARAIYYDQKAVVRIHLGRTFNHRTVELFAQTLHRAKHRILTGRVNRIGDLVAKVAMNQNTKFSAAFDGDYRYAPAKTTAVTEYSGYRPYIGLGGGYATSGKYRLFHADKYVKLTGTLLPAKAGRCLQFASFHRANGKWVNDGASQCFSTNRRGVALAYFHPPHPKIGVPYAIESFYNGDDSHTWSTSGAKFVKFTAASARAAARTSWKGTWTIGR
jgi:hypothetical protein